MLRTLEYFGALLVVAGVAMPAGATTVMRGQLADPVSLNIGLNCQWELSCINRHKRAMKKSLKFVDKYKPPQWRIEQCNRNAQRGRERVDWIGFDRCIRNPNVKYTPPSPTAPAKSNSRTAAKKKKPAR